MSIHPAVLSVVALDRVVLFDERDARVHELNPSASLIWDAIDGRVTIGELAEHIAALVDQDVRSEVIGTIRDLVAGGLLTVDDPQP